MDEYQDFNRLEVEFIKTLGQRSPLLVVGDDDQAVYSFKQASANFIRDLAQGGEFERFELPFCSRCTEVLVAATHTVVNRAVERGLLSGRIEKRYECFLPGKLEASNDNPRIIHAKCSVDYAKAHYPARYIELAMVGVSEDEIAKSWKENEPTVLVIGPKQFLKPIHEHLTKRFDYVSFKSDDKPSVKAIHAIKPLLKDDQSNLGWRILLFVEPTAGLDEILTKVLQNGLLLADLLPPEFRARWLAAVGLARRVMEREVLNADEAAALEKAFGVGPEALYSAVSIDQEEVQPEVEPDKTQPRITITTLIGAKGLQAAHVFVVGVNEKHFPSDNDNVTDDEVCQLLVALTRAKQSCTLVSVGRFGSVQLNPSVFTNWLAPHLTHKRVDKSFFASL